MLKFTIFCICEKRLFFLVDLLVELRSDFDLGLKLSKKLLDLLLLLETATAAANPPSRGNSPPKVPDSFSDWLGCFGT